VGRGKGLNSIAATAEESGFDTGNLQRLRELFIALRSAQAFFNQHAN
jgi:hypothetical protein